MLLVNSAAHCGFTRQHADLRNVGQRCQKYGLFVLGDPYSYVGGQEPGSETEIKALCETNFDVDFPLTEKVNIKGSAAHRFCRWARDSLGTMSKQRRNFHKYLISPDGKIADWFSTVTSPTSGRLLRAVETVLPR